MNHSIQFIFFYFVNIESVHSFDDRFLLFQSVKANFSPFVHLVVSKIDIKYIYEMKRTHICTHACHQVPGSTWSQSKANRFRIYWYWLHSHIRFSKENSKTSNHLFGPLWWAFACVWMPLRVIGCVTSIDTYRKMFEDEEEE